MYSYHLHIYSLPEALKVAFESQDVSNLQRAIAAMPQKEAKYWMKQCVDSGLWVPKDNTVFEDGPDGEGENEEEEEKVA